jgi:hypothetical protein
VFFFRSYVICPGIMFTRRSLISWPRYPWLFLQWPRSCLRIYLARATRNPPKLGSKFHITCSNFCSSKIVACMTLLRTWNCQSNLFMVCSVSCIDKQM